jgi:hypothetical protein
MERKRGVGQTGRLSAVHWHHESGPQSHTKRKKPSHRVGSHMFIRFHRFSSRRLYTHADLLRTSTKICPGSTRTASSSSGLENSRQPRRSPLLTVVFATSFVLGSGLFAVYYFDARSAIHRYFLAPLLRHTLDAETGHKVAVKVLRSGLGPKDPLVDDQRLNCEVRSWSRGILS